MGTDQKVDVGAVIDEEAEGPRRSPSCCATLAKLLFHGQFVKVFLASD